MPNLNNLFKIMGELGINSKILSDNTGISTGNISDWKSGRSMPTAKKLVIIADYLDCSIDFLLGRTDEPEMNKSRISLSIPALHDDESLSKPKKILPFYRTATSAGLGSYLYDDIPVEYITIRKNDITSAADYILQVSGDSMEPKFYDGDCVLIQRTERIFEGQIGIFILNGESYIKKMGNGELISLNSAYAPIRLHDYDDIRCAGRVLDIIVLD